MEAYGSMVNVLRRNFRKGILRSANQRQTLLRRLFALIEENEEQLYDALHKDLHKCRVEANMAEINYSKSEIAYAINNLHKWMKPERVKTDVINKTSTCEIRRDPLGVVLIIGAWNYPIALNLVPLVGAIAAGNCAIVKPSEISANSAKVLAELIPKYIDEDCVRVVDGGVPEITALLRERFDHIFYTGGSLVGKIMMKAAAEHLTPVTLELGGKCPTIVDETCDIDVVAQRIAWAKTANSGQVCLAPDYVICVGDVQERLAESLKKAIIKFYGEDAQKSDSYGRMINNRHFLRVKNLIDASKVSYGNVTDEDDLYISPTIMKNVMPDDDVMKEEIFGPVLPLVNVATVDEAIDYVLDREKPLALYVFSNNYDTTERVAQEVSCGGMLVNDCLMHYSVKTLPFGGVGASGIGSYHGIHSFNAFTHNKAYMYKNQRLESLNAVRYPPYDENWKPLQFAQWLMTPKV